MLLRLRQFSLRNLGQFLTFALVIVLFANGKAFSVEPKLPSSSSPVRRAIFSDGALWLLSESGELSRIEEAGKAREPEVLSGTVIDLCRFQGHPLAAVCEDSECDRYTLFQGMGKQWRKMVTLSRDHQKFLALACSEDELVALTDHRLTTVKGGELSAVILSKQIRSWGNTTTLLHGGNVYLGFNQGEWGGGMWRIDRRNGEAKVLSHNQSGKSCAGPLSAECDPVNAVIASPWKEGCVLAAIGLVHFGTKGRIVQVCGDAIESFFSYRPAVGDDVSEEAFFSLALHRARATGRTAHESGEGVSEAKGDTATRVLWASGSGGLYEINLGSKGESIPLPPLSEVGDIRVSFADPSVVVLVSDFNRAKPSGGLVTLLIAR